MFSFLSSLFSHDKTPVPASIYDFKVAGLTGGVIDFSAFRGKKILIVNTASKCGKTPQYAGLEALYKSQNGKLAIVGFPANNFLFQEPGSSADIASFCQINYGVTFPIAEKVSVKGWKKAPIYRWLTEKQYNGYRNSSVKWNFQKYLIDERGALAGIFDPSTLPTDPALVAAINA